MQLHTSSSLHPNATQSHAEQFNIERTLHAIETPKDSAATRRSEASNMLNTAEIHSKPMSVLDELENFWEKNDASKGVSQKGILAEHIMERQAEELKKNGKA